MLDGFNELTEIDKILEKLELNKYHDHLFSVDFWYDFLRVKKVYQESNFPMNTHAISTYLLPLAEKEYDRIASYGRKYRFTKQNDGGYLIDMPNGNNYKIKKSAALDYIFYLINNRYEYPKSIDIADLYAAVNGSEYDGGRDALLNTVRNAFKYLFGKQQSELQDLKDCFQISEKGCYFEQKGNIRLKISSQH